MTSGGERAVDQPDTLMRRAAGHKQWLDPAQTKVRKVGLGRVKQGVVLASIRHG
jgi:hypothetical protein